MAKFPFPNIPVDDQFAQVAIFELLRSGPREHLFAVHQRDFQPQRVFDLASGLPAACRVRSTVSVQV